MNTQSSESASHRRCGSSKSSTAASTRSSVGSDSDIPLQRLQVKGATCGGCVRSIEQTLRSVSGVTDACMDLATGVASVVGMDRGIGSGGISRDTSRVDPFRQ